MSRKCEYELRLALSLKEKPKLFHGYIRSKKMSRPRVGPILVGDRVVSESLEIADALVDAFAAVQSADVPESPCHHQIFHGQLSSVELSVDGVSKQLRKLKTDSSMGPDFIHPVVFKGCATPWLNRCLSFSTDLSKKCVFLVDGRNLPSFLFTRAVFTQTL